MSTLHVKVDDSASPHLSKMLKTVVDGLIIMLRKTVVEMDRAAFPDLRVSLVLTCCHQHVIPLAAVQVSLLLPLLCPVVWFFTKILDSPSLPQRQREKDSTAP